MQCSLRNYTHDRSQQGVQLLNLMKDTFFSEVGGKHGRNPINQH